MNIILFELKKFWRKRNFLWILVVILLFVSGNFVQNYLEKSTMQARAEKKFQPYIEETDKIYQDLQRNQSDKVPDEVQLRQQEQIIEIGKALYNLKLSITNKEWDKIPTYENDFLEGLVQYSKYGGEFHSLQGVERSQAIAKNEWFIKHHLPYIDEEYPLAPILFLKENTKILFGVVGVVVLLFLFGNIMTVEKEQNTWVFLTTQPIPNWKLIFGKFISLLIITAAFIVLVIVIGLALPWIYDHRIYLQYPQLVGSKQTFSIISTTYYLMREIVLFTNTCLITFGIVLLLSRWIKNSFTVFISTCFVLIVGISFTGMNQFLQTVWNPFQSFHYNEILNESPSSTEWRLLFFAIVWSFSCVFLSVFLPKKESKLLNSSYLPPFQKGETKINANPLLVATLFEYRKVRRNGLFRKMNLFLSILIMLGYFFLSEQTQEKKKSYFQELKQSEHILESVVYPDMKQQIAILENEPEDSNLKEQLEDLKKGEAVIQETQKKNKAAVSSYKKGKWTPLYEYQLFQTRFANKEFDSGNLQNAFKETLGQFTIDVSIAEKNWLIDHHIYPVFSGDFLPTVFSNEKIDSNKWLEMNQKLDNSGLYSLYIFFKDYLYLVLIGLLILLFGSGIADERGKMNTLRFLKTQPIASKQIFLGKVLNSTILSFLNFLGLFLYVLIIGTLFNRFGDWEYPILYYDHPIIAGSSTYTGTISYRGNGFHFSPIGINLMKSILLLLCLCLFTIVLSHLLSLFFKNSLSVFSATILTVAIGCIASTQILTNHAYFSPFTYFDITKTTNGELSILLDQPNVNAQMGCIVLLLSTLILLISGYLLVSRNNLLK
ncbi:ABC transporter permease subunit [Bacillus sp. AL-1R]